MKSKALMMTVAVIAVAFAACGKSHNSNMPNTGSADTVAEVTNQNVAEEVALFDAETEEKVMAERRPGALSYERMGYYNLKGLNSEDTKVNYFPGDNSFYEVVTDSEGHFAMCIHNTGEHGLSFWSTYFKDGSFVGMTENYSLFENEEGKVIAVSHEKKENCTVGDYAYETVPYEELEENEQNAVYPIVNQELEMT